MFPSMSEHNAKCPTPGMGNLGVCTWPPPDV